MIKKIFIVFLISQSYLLAQEVSPIAGAEPETRGTDTRIAEENGRQIIIINNNIPNTTNNQNDLGRSNEVAPPSELLQPKTPQSEAPQPAAAQPETPQKQKKAPGNLGAFYYRVGYGSIKGETELGNLLPLANILSGTNTKPEHSGFLKFLHATLGLSLAESIGSSSFAGIYLGLRGSLVTNGQFATSGVLLKPVLRDREQGYIVGGLGFDVGPYFRAGLWGKNKAGGIGASFYGHISLLSSSPDPQTPFFLFGAGVMLDIFITEEFGFSGSVELLVSRYVSATNDTFRALGPSFSLGIALGL